MDEFNSKKVKVVLPIKLNAVELGSFAKRNVASIERKHDEIEGLKKLAAIKKKELEEAEAKYVEVIQTGIEEREVECEEVINFAQGRVRYLELVSKKLLHERDITDAERQMDIFQGFSDPVKKKAVKRDCAKCGGSYVGTKRICFNCEKLDEFRFAPEGA